MITFIVFIYAGINYVDLLVCVTVKSCVNFDSENIDFPVLEN